MAVSKRAIGSRIRYLAVEGSQLSDDDAKVVGDVIERIEAKHGSVTPKLFYEEAKRRDSPVHYLFEWDIRKAALQYWLERAGRIIRSVKVDIVGPRGPQSVRAFVSVSGAEGRSYMSTVNAMSNVDFRGQILEKALADLETFKARYSAYEELAAIFEAMEKVGNKLRKRRAS